MSAVVFLLVCFLSCSVSEELQKHLITAKPGDDVTLPCEAPNVPISLVKWSRPDLNKHVYLKSDGHVVTAVQDPSYVNRVQLEDDEMKNGDLSLILKNVTNNDEGTYECFYVEERGGKKNELIVYLIVTELQEQWITAKPGGDVTLPCQAPNNAITAVDWSRFDLKRYIFLKRGGRLNTADQDPSYVDRVQLKDDEMKNGNLSLILKNVTNNDEGRYECRYEKEGGGAVQIKLISIVYLKVRDPQRIQQMTVQPGDNVTLRCEAPNVIITAVEWSRPDHDHDRHVYWKTDGHLNTADQDPSYVDRVQLEDDEMKNGDLSLILKNVNNNDEGTYECHYVEKGGRGRRRKREDRIKLSRIIQLKVEGPTDGDSESGKHSGGGNYLTGFILSVILNVAVFVGLVIYMKLKGRSEKKPDLPVDDPDVLQQLQENENSL